MARLKYTPTDRERRVLDHVENPRYDRQIVNGLDPFIKQSAPEGMRGFYTPVELSDLQQLKDTDRDVEDRMPVKITRHYFEMARNSPALQKLVKASPDETVNLEGEEDPASQLDYSPVEGLLHKYELALLYVISTCSAHCRFCYREDLIARKDIERADGTVKKKGLARVNEVTDYIRAHNAAVDANGGKHPRDRAAQAARDPAVGRRSDGAAQLQAGRLVHRAGRGGRGGHQSGDQGTRLPSRPLRRRLPVDARPLPRGLPRRGLQADGPLQPP